MDSHGNSQRRPGRRGPKPKQPQERTPRRTQVVDDDGWTHVVSTSKRPQHRKGKGKMTTKENSLPLQEDVLVPAEAPDGLTFEQLKEKFQKHLERWESSRTWLRLKENLGSAQLKAVSQILEQCVCIGLGSPSGLLRGGIVDRRAVSMYQLAALASLLHHLNRTAPRAIDANQAPNQEVSPASNPLKCYAQDPVFNELDIKLLEYLGITVLTDTAFSLVDGSTFLYAPGAERAQLALLLDKRPPLFFGGPLSDISSVTVSEERATEARAIDAYAATTTAAELSKFEPSENAFWRMSLFWQSEQNEDVET